MSLHMPLSIALEPESEQGGDRRFLNTDTSRALARGTQPTGLVWGQGCPADRVVPPGFSPHKMLVARRGVAQELSSASAGATTPLPPSSESHSDHEDDEDVELCSQSCSGILQSRFVQGCLRFDTSLRFSACSARTEVLAVSCSSCAFW